MGRLSILGQKPLKSSKSITSEGNRRGSDGCRRSSGADRSPERRRSRGLDKSPERRRSAGADKSTERRNLNGADKLADCSRRSSGLPNGLSKSWLRIIFHECRHLMSGSDEVGTYSSNTKLQKACRVVLVATHNMLRSHDVVGHWQNTAKALALDRQQAAEDEYDVDDSSSFGGDSDDDTNENYGIDVSTLLDRFIVDSGDERMDESKDTKRDSLSSYLKGLVFEAVELQRSHQNAEVQATQDKYRNLLKEFEDKLQDLESSKQTFKKLSIIANSLETRFRSEDENCTCDKSSTDLCPDSHGSVHQHIDAIIQEVGKSATYDDSSLEESQILELLEAVGLKGDQNDGASSDALIGTRDLDIEDALAAEEMVDSLGKGTENARSGSPQEQGRADCFQQFFEANGCQSCGRAFSGSSCEHCLAPQGEILPEQVKACTPDYSDLQSPQMNLQSRLIDEVHAVMPKPPAEAKGMIRPLFRSGRFSRPLTPPTTHSLQHESGEASQKLASGANMNCESLAQEKVVAVLRQDCACSITEEKIRHRSPRGNLMADLSAQELMLRIKERIDSEYEHTYASDRTRYPYPKASPLSQRIKFNSLPSLCQEAYKRSSASSPARSPSSSREACGCCSDCAKPAHSPVSTRSSSKKTLHVSLELVGEERKPLQSPISSRSSSRRRVHAPPELDFGVATPPSNRKIVLPPLKNQGAEIDMRHTKMSPQTRQSSGSPASHCQRASKQGCPSVATLAAKINCEMTKQHLEASGISTFRHGEDAIF